MLPARFSLILNMTSVEIRSEIEKVLDQVPENTLIDVLSFLNELKTKSADDVRLAANLKKILSEDRELLKKLAK